MAVAKVIEAASVDDLSSATEFYEQRNLLEAERLCRGYLQHHPNEPAALHLLGRITLKAGNPVFAAAFFRRAIAGRSDDSTFYRHYGQALRAAGKFDEARSALERAVELRPDEVKPRVNLASLLSDMGQHLDAIAQCEKAIELDPKAVAAHVNLGVARQSRFELEAAKACFRRVLELDPDNVNALENLGGALMSEGRHAEAEMLLRRVIEIEPSLSEAHSNLLFALHYSLVHDREALLREAKLWGQQHADPLAKDIRPHVNVPDPDRRLRIGYVSGDFHRHPVGYFLEAVIAGHDKQQVEVFCYTNHYGVDDLTLRLHAAADHWKSLVGITDANVADAIRRDQIDILVDLTGHTGGHRLGVFARKPAPVQATWIGYFGTTGVKAIDYIIVDRFLCPEGDEAYYSEAVVRLPDSYLCFAPQASPEIGPLPALSRDYVTFGSFNKVAKLTPDVVSLWARILHAVPGARLCLKDSAIDDVAVQRRCRDLFAERGISEDRLTLLGRTPYTEHLTAYRDVDLALDPFPFNGGTTTVESLWMGVPVVTLAGDHFVSRMGVSHLSTVGLSELIAISEDDYFERAVTLANDLPRLIQYRSELRQRVTRSSLCDGPRFTRGVEAAYRDMWYRWCRSRVTANVSDIGDDFQVRAR